jgi:hypothetical protein
MKIGNPGGNRMPNKRDLKLDEYNISKYAYRELANFCLQYPEKKRKIADLHNPLKAQRYSGMPHGTDVGEPTASAAERAAQLSADCELIEQTAIEADAGIYQWLLLAVTQGLSYRVLRECDINGIGRMPAGEEMFNNRRHRFFYILAKKRKII